MKKLLSLFLILAMLMSFAACGAVAQDSASVNTTVPENWPPLDAMETSGVTEQTQDRETHPTQPEDLLPPQTDYTGPAETSPTEPAIPGTPDDTRPRGDEEDRPVEDPPQQNNSQPTQPEELPEQTDPQPTEPPTTVPSQDFGLDPNGSYDSKWTVAQYIVTYGKLPKNYITKSQADRLGWGGNTGYTIGGDRFYNREGRLPSGYTYYECDIGTLGGSKRGAKRLVYTKSGIVYYTGDHYETFELLYGDP